MNDLEEGTVGLGTSTSGHRSADCGRSHRRINYGERLRSYAAPANGTAALRAAVAHLETVREAEARKTIAPALVNDKSAPGRASGIRSAGSQIALAALA